MKAKHEILRLQRKIKSGEMDPDEPLFVLRARDRLATPTVMSWAAHAKVMGVPTEKVAEVLDLGVAMNKWPEKRTPGCGPGS